MKNCAVGSIPAGVIGIFHCLNSSSRALALESTESLTEMNTRNINGGRSGRCVSMTTLRPISRNLEASTSLKPQVCSRIASLFRYCS